MAYFCISPSYLEKNSIFINTYTGVSLSEKGTIYSTKICKMIVVVILSLFNI